MSCSSSASCKPIPTGVTSSTTRRRARCGAWATFAQPKTDASHSHPQVELIDFGATRAYSEEFIDKFRALLLAAIAEDEPQCLHWSRELGYLTGDENEVCWIHLRISLRRIADSALFSLHRS